MIVFLDGPACNVIPGTRMYATTGARGLCIRRAPQFLRVTQNSKGEWDALDQLHDEPHSDETVMVYRLVERLGSLHLNMRDKKGRHCGGFFVSAVYQYVSPQPDEATLNETHLWREWAQQQSIKEALRT